MALNLIENVRYLFPFSVAFSTWKTFLINCGKRFVFECGNAGQITMRLDKCVNEKFMQKIRLVDTRFWGALFTLQIRNKWKFIAFLCGTFYVHWRKTDSKFSSKASTIMNVWKSDGAAKKSGKKVKKLLTIITFIAMVLLAFLFQRSFFSLRHVHPFHFVHLRVFRRRIVNNFFLSRHQWLW